MIVLTDGAQNRGFFDPLDAANVARENGMDVYAVGVGTVDKDEQRVSLVVIRNLFFTS